MKKLHHKAIVVKLPEGSVMRADAYVASTDLLTRSQIKERNLIIKISSKVIKPSRKVTNGDELELEWEEAVTHNIIPEQMDLDIIYEDKNVLVLNKKQGVVVHPGAGNYSGTIVNGILFHNKKEAEAMGGDPERPGIVHRLDKDTSGVIITAKNIETLEYLSEQFRNRETIKEYKAIVKGIPSPSMERIVTFLKRDRVNRKKYCVDPYSGKEAITNYRIKKQWQSGSLLDITIETGRTHQIRVHMAHKRTPIIGDELYSRRNQKLGNFTLMLHAYSLTIKLPGEEESRTFVAELPKRFELLCQRLEALDK